VGIEYDGKRIHTRRSDRRVSVRAIRREPPDVKKISRAIIALALAQAEAEAEASAGREDPGPTDAPEAAAVPEEAQDE
jgi:hypothetical protein